MGFSGGIPWVSLLALAYPITAGVWMYRSAAPTGHAGALVPGMGYGLANLGYVLLAAGIVGDSFAILGLHRRPRVLLVAAGAWVRGTVQTNVG